MTVKQYIQKDMKSGDFTAQEIKHITNALRRVPYQRLLNEEYEDYDQVDEFYQVVL